MILDVILVSNHVIIMFCLVITFYNLSDPCQGICVFLNCILKNYQGI